jgi:hypothetical protein
MNLNLAVIGDEAHLAKLVHEEAYTRAGGVDHLCKCLLASLRDDRLGRAIPSRNFPEVEDARAASRWN